MEEKEQEGMNMDSAPGNMPPEKTPSKLKQSLPKGEINPWTRNLFPPSQRHDYAYEREKNAGKKLEEAEINADSDKAVGLLPDGRQKQELKDQFALQETTANTQRMLKEDDEKKMKAWIQQNPVAAVSIGVSAEDPYGLKGKSPAKYLAERKKKSPLKAYQFMNPLQAHEFGRRMHTNPMATIGVEAGQIIGDKIAQWSERRAEQRRLDQEQYEREAKETEDTFAPLIQSLDSSASIDEAEKELMTQQWKQEFAELNKLKNQHPPGISAEEYAIKKSQLLSNAQNYTKSVENLTAAAQQWEQDLQSGLVSDATPRNQRDILNSLAKGEGMNIFSTEDGKTGTNKGLTIKNVNGQPTLTGYTQGQVANIRKEYEKELANNGMDQKDVPFEAWFSQRATDPANQPGGTNYDNLSDDWKGVNIPIEKLATGDGVPRYVKKDTAFSDNIDQSVDNLVGQALSSSNALNMDSAQKWGVVTQRVEELAAKMLKAAPDDTLRSIASDYMGVPYEEYEEWLQNPNGIDGVRAHLQKDLVEAMRQRFITSPEIIKADQQIANRRQQYELAQQRIANSGGRSGTGATATEIKQQNANQIKEYALTKLNEVTQNGNINSMIGTEFPGNVTFQGLHQGPDGKMVLLLGEGTSGTQRKVPVANMAEAFKYLQNSLQATQVGTQQGPMTEGQSAKLNENTAKYW